MGAGEKPVDGELQAFLAHALSQLDWARLDVIRQDLPKIGSEGKYLDARAWLARAWTQARDLNLRTQDRITFLDIGTGPGYLPYVGRYLGHDADAMDMPGIALYDALCDWLGLYRISHRIMPRQPLPRLTRRYDLVTAIRIGFNTKPDGTLFDLADWAFFLDDVRDNVLEPGGRLVLKMIKQADRVGLKFGDAPLMQFFAERGGAFDHKRRAITFDPLR